MGKKPKDIYGHIIGSFAWVGGSTMLLVVLNLAWLVWQVYNSFRSIS